MCTAIRNKNDDINKIDAIIDTQISDSIYVETTENKHWLKHLQDFLFTHFKDTDIYKDIRPISNKPTRFFATAKTHKFMSRRHVLGWKQNAMIIKINYMYIAVKVSYGCANLLCSEGNFYG